MITSLILSSLDRRARIFLYVLALAALLVPVLNLALPPASFLHVPTYVVALLGKYICFAILALALDLVWGYCGILSLGHGAFFALGGYAMGMYLMRQIGTRGVYAHPVLPDFMVFLNWKELPWYWLGFSSFPFAMFMVLAVPGLLAFAFGWFAFRSRVTGVYLSIITQALTYALLLAFFRNDMGFGGNNGLTDFKDILGFPVQAQSTRLALYVASLLLLAASFIVARVLVTSTFGKVLVAIRDAEQRTRFLGYRVENYKLVVFTVSACMAGLAGALYVPQVGIINPSEFSPANSIEAVIWVAVGGRGMLVGAVIGAFVVNLMKTLLTSGFLAKIAGAIGLTWLFGVLGLDGAALTQKLFGAEAWLYALGGLFILVTLALPKGILGTITEWLDRRLAGKNGKADGAAIPKPAE